MPTPTPSDTLVRRYPERPTTWSFEPSERRVRGLVDDVALVDSREPILVWEPRHKVPEYGFPVADVRTDLLETTDTAPADGLYYRPRRPVRQWFHARVGDRLIEHAAWRWDVPGLEDYLGVTWFPGVLDGWLEEDEPVITHPRDPHVRVDALASDRHVVVRHGDLVIAESRRPVAVFETELPTRWYLPVEDVDLDALTVSDTWSECPYKGRTTGYWSLGPDLPDIAWSYATPFPAVGAIAGRIAFYSEKVEVVVDGVRITPPTHPAPTAPQETP